MYETTLILHIATMIGSMALMLSALGFGFFGKKVAVNVATVGMITTVVGFTTGLGLMFGAPLTVKCAIMTAYLVAVATVYYVGFGFGRQANALFVRSR